MGDKPPLEREMGRPRNPLGISSGVKLHGETPTNGASTQTMPQKEESGEMIGDQVNAGTITKKIADINRKKLPEVKADVAPKTVRRAAIN